MTWGQLGKTQDQAAICMKRVTENGLVVKVLRRILGQIQDWSLGETKGFSMILGDKKEQTVFSKDQWKEWNG